MSRKIPGISPGRFRDELSLRPRVWSHETQTQVNGIGRERREDAEVPSHDRAMAESWLHSISGGDKSQGEQVAAKSLDIDGPPPQAGASNLMPKSTFFARNGMFLRRLAACGLSMVGERLWAAGSWAGRTAWRGANATFATTSSMVGAATRGFSRHPELEVAAPAERSRRAAQGAVMTASRAGATPGATVEALAGSPRPGRAAARGLRSAASLGWRASATVGKKIPLLGLGVGLVAATCRAMSGDWEGAGLEAASGLAACVPGVGTAASCAIDAALLTRDLIPPHDESSHTPVRLEEHGFQRASPETARRAMARQCDARMTRDAERGERAARGPTGQAQELGSPRVSAAEAMLGRVPAWSAKERELVRSERV